MTPIITVCCALTFEVGVGIGECQRRHNGAEVEIGEWWGDSAAGCGATTHSPAATTLQ